MMVFFSFLVVSMMFVFPNSLYFTFSILYVVISSLYFLVSSHHLTTLTMIMLCIVYVGAMMILIGYICAICPNLNLSSSFGVSPLMFFSLLVSYLSSPLTFSPFSSFGSILDYMYSGDGLSLFFLMVFMLFITLLMVTSQYLVPKGPFRSTV
uniref:NADH dehydrogenase subunit 6 n=1 Tax=Proales similis TaxID=360698 RepID=A0A7D4X6E9_9BILA|nr:NADH dehydrogenase subunit 6 [Proales similis]